MNATQTNAKEAPAMHTIISVESFTATSPTALDGNKATCSCGYVVRTSLSKGQAGLEGLHHVNWMNRKEAGK